MILIEYILSNFDRYVSDSSDDGGIIDEKYENLREK